jgi:hypothetical protein
LDFDSTESAIESELETSTLLLKKQTQLGAHAYHAATAYAILAFANILFTEVFPLWCVAPYPIGLSLNAVQIGALLSTLGIVSICCQLLVYPAMSRRYSALDLYMYPMPLYLLTFIFIPLVPVLFKGPMMWSAVVFFLGLKGIVENFLFTSIMVLVCLF